MAPGHPRPSQKWSQYQDLTTYASLLPLTRAHGSAKQGRPEYSPALPIPRKLCLFKLMAVRRGWWMRRWRLPSHHCWQKTGQPQLTVQKERNVWFLKCWKGSLAPKCISPTQPLIQAAQDVFERVTSFLCFPLLLWIPHHKAPVTKCTSLYKNTSPSPLHNPQLYLPCSQNPHIFPEAQNNDHSWIKPPTEACAPDANSSEQHSSNLFIPSSQEDRYIPSSQGSRPWLQGQAPNNWFMFPLLSCLKLGFLEMDPEMESCLLKVYWGVLLRCREVRKAGSCRGKNWPTMWLQHRFQTIQWETLMLGWLLRVIPNCKKSQAFYTYISQLLAIGCLVGKGAHLGWGSSLELQSNFHWGKWAISAMSHYQQIFPGARNRSIYSEERSEWSRTVSLATYPLQIQIHLLFIANLPPS